MRIIRSKANNTRNKIKKNTTKFAITNLLRHRLALFSTSSWRSPMRVPGNRGELMKGRNAPVEDTIVRDNPDSWEDSHQTCELCRISKSRDPWTKHFGVWRMHRFISILNTRRIDLSATRSWRLEILDVTRMLLSKGEPSPRIEWSFSNFQNLEIRIDSKWFF